MPLGGVNINQGHGPNFSDPFALLVHCHRKIEGQLQVLERVAELLPKADVQSLPQIFAAVEAACAHFGFAGDKHTADEEISLFPRLRQWGGAAGDEALAAIAELESDHRIAELLHTRFDKLVATIPRDGSADNNILNDFADVTTELITLYRPHIELEDTFVFPIAQRVLPTFQIQLIGIEMRGRRQDMLRTFQLTPRAS